MNTSGLVSLRLDLETAKRLLLRMAVREQVLAISGPGELVDWDEYAPGVAALGRIELGLLRVVALAKTAAPELLDKLKSFSDKSPLILQSAEISVNVQVAAARRIDGQVVVLARKTASIFSYFAGGGFVKKIMSQKPDLSVREMVVDIDRLLPLLDALKISVDSSAEKP